MVVLKRGMAIINGEPGPSPDRNTLCQLCTNSGKGVTRNNLRIIMHGRKREESSTKGSYVLSHKKGVTRNNLRIIMYGRKREESSTKGSYVLSHKKDYGHLSPGALVQKYWGEEERKG
jgi:hypothetical protein